RTTNPDHGLGPVLSQLALDRAGVPRLHGDVVLGPLAEPALDNRPVAEVILLLEAVVRDAKLGAVKRTADLKLSANDKLADRHRLAGSCERDLDGAERRRRNVRDDEVLDQLNRREKPRPPVINALDRYRSDFFLEDDPLVRIDGSDPDPACLHIEEGERV